MLWSNWMRMIWAPMDWTEISTCTRHVAALDGWNLTVFSLGETGCGCLDSSSLSTGTKGTRHALQPLRPQFLGFMRVAWTCIARFLWSGSQCLLKQHAPSYFSATGFPKKNALLPGTVKVVSPACRMSKLPHIVYVGVLHIASRELQSLRRGDGLLLTRPIRARSHAQ